MTHTHTSRPLDNNSLILVVHCLRQFEEKNKSTKITCDTSQSTKKGRPLSLIWNGKKKRNAKRNERTRNDWMQSCSLFFFCQQLILSELNCLKGNSIGSMECMCTCFLLMKDKRSVSWESGSLWWLYIRPFFHRVCHVIFLSKGNSLQGMVCFTHESHSWSKAFILETARV